MRSLLKNVLKKFPWIFLILKEWKTKKKFGNEIRYLNGKCPPQSSRQSIIFFSVYRSASTFMGKTLGKIASESGLIPIDLDSYFFHLGKGREWEGKGRRFVPVTYRSTGFFYGPFRSFNSEIPDLDDYRILLILRDPRDAIVSSYYAMYSHALPRSYSEKKAQRVLTRRKQRLEQTVDEYVLTKMAPESRFLKRYITYHEKLMGQKNVLFLKYEDIVKDFHLSLDKIVEFFQLDVDPSLLDTIKVQANFSIQAEDVFRHKRQVTPGDHRRKLTRETIERINSQIDDVLRLFDYPL
jgi:hypothetical protein